MRAAERGAEGQIRTDDTRLFRAVLYQLSYLGPFLAAAFARRPRIGFPTIAQGPNERQRETGGGHGSRSGFGPAELARETTQVSHPFGDRRMGVPHPTSSGPRSILIGLTM